MLRLADVSGLALVKTATVLQLQLHSLTRAGADGLRGLDSTVLVVCHVVSVAAHGEVSSDFLVEFHNPPKAGGLKQFGRLTRFLA